MSNAPSQMAPARWFPSSTLELPPAAGSTTDWITNYAFFRDLIKDCKPRVFVGLGLRSHATYLAFCHSIADAEITCRAYAIAGARLDESSIAEGAGVSLFQKLRSANTEYYSQFSHILDCAPEQAIDRFADASVDLLYWDTAFVPDETDGLAWLRKLRPGGLLLMENVAVPQAASPRWRLWEEIKAKGQCFEFFHEGGLGIWRTPGGPEISAGMLGTLYCGSVAEQQHLRTYYFLAGRELKGRSTRASGGKIDALRIEIRLESENWSASAAIRPEVWQFVRLGVPGGVFEKRLHIRLPNFPLLADLKTVAIRRETDKSLVWSASGGLLQGRDLELGGSGAHVPIDPGSEFVRYFNFGTDAELILPKFETRVFDQPLHLDLWLRVHTTLGALLPLVDGKPAQQERRFPSGATAGFSQPPLAGARLESSNGVSALSGFSSVQAERTPSPELSREKLLRELDRKQTAVNLLLGVQDELQRCTEELDQTKRDYELLQEDFMRLTQAHAIAESDLRGLRIAFDGVLSSLSWKITAPLRSILHALRGER